MPLVLPYKPDTKQMKISRKGAKAKEKKED
jgi:hypothetical protein